MKKALLIAISVCIMLFSFTFAAESYGIKVQLNGEYLDFTDELFAPIRYFCGSKFVGGPDKWIYPVGPINTIYPYKGYMEEAFPVQFYKLYY